jgi:hypothetical protein
MPAYYTEPVVTLPVEAAPEAGQAAPALPPGVSPEAVTRFDQARAVFLEGKYDEALKLTDVAIAQMPRDAVLHEFRSMIRHWDANTGKLLGSIDRKRTYAWNGVISPDGRTAAVPLKDDLLLVNVESDQDLGRLPDLVPWGRPKHAIFSSDAGFLIAGSHDGEVGIAEIATRSVVTRISLNRKGNQKLAQWPTPKSNTKADLEREPPLDQPTLEALAVSRDGRLVATSEAFDFRRALAKFSVSPSPKCLSLLALKRLGELPSSYGV